MVQSELDSFYVKFKHLLRAEKDATLTIKSEAGRAVITLSVDLGHVLSEPGHHQSSGHHPLRPRNGPSRQRRREKRAAAREQQEAVAVEEAEKESKESESAVNVDQKDVETNTNDSVEKTDFAFVAEEVTANTDDEEKKDTEEVDLKGSVDDLVVDEFCSNASYNDERKEPTPSAPPPTTFRSPPPSTPRGLGGIDYYNKTYDEDDG